MKPLFAIALFFVIMSSAIPAFAASNSMCGLTKNPSLSCGRNNCKPADCPDHYGQFFFAIFIALIEMFPYLSKF